MEVLLSFFELYGFHRMERTVENVQTRVRSPPRLKHVYNVRQHEGRPRGWGEKGHGRVNVRPQHTNEMRGAGCVIQPKGFSRADYSF